MIKCESQTDSPLYSIHGTIPLAPAPPLSVNYQVENRSFQQINQKVILAAKGLSKMHAFSSNLHKKHTFSGKCTHFMQIR